MRTKMLVIFIKVYSCALKTTFLVTLKVIEGWIIRVELCHKALLFLFQMLIFIFFLWRLWFSTIWLQRLKGFLRYDTTSKVFRFLLESWEFSRLNLFYSNAFKYCFALATCYNKHTIWYIATLHKRFSEEISLFLYVEDHLK